jgi:hypothetical protein
MLSVTQAEGAEMKANLVAVQAKTDTAEFAAAGVEVDGRR